MSSPILNMFEIIPFFKDVDKLNKCWRPNLYKIPMNEKIELKYKRSRLLRCDLVILKPWNTKSIERPKGAGCIYAGTQETKVEYRKTTP